MLPCISEPRAELSKYAPKMLSTLINPEKIGDVIGKQGKVIQKIQADCDCKIDIEEDGRVFISAIDLDNAKRALTIVELIAKDPEIGAIYNGVVTRLMSFGAFVEIAPGKEGLVHISRLDVKRTEKVEDVVNVGDTVLVKVLEIDDQGRLNLSRRDALIEVKGLVPENDIDEEPKKLLPNYPQIPKCFHATVGKGQNAFTQLSAKGKKQRRVDTRKSGSALLFI
jgi:polyribonucleotide nucleotidyltransferase